MLFSCSCALLLCVVGMREERSSFYRWIGRVYSLDTLKWKVQTALSIEFTAFPTWTVLGEVVWTDPWSLGPNGATRGVPAPPLGLLGPIFSGSTPLGLLSGSMWVPRNDEPIWFGFSLILLLFGPYFAWLCASLLWACAEWYLCFVLLHVFSPFMCIPTNALLQMNKHQNSWKSLVINPISKFGVLFSRFYINVGSKKCELRTTNKLPHT